MTKPPAFIFLLLLCGFSYAAEPTTQPSLVSKAVEKDGMSVTVTLAKKAFAQGEPLKFDVQFKNVSTKAFTLNDIEYFWNWPVMIDDVQKNGPWRVTRAIVDGAHMPKYTVLKPAETLTVAISLDPKSVDILMQWHGVQDGAIPAIRQLPPGQYKIHFTVTGTEPAQMRQLPLNPFWTGEIISDPLDFEVTDKPAPPATQPAARNGPVPSTQP